ncbi:hypothetical protein B0H14DRAFT_3111448 [Mycena olivaceomarginata]|nr:hypothetical protein B0H14DRAFT_3111448 [Mycena olivaceomarginata]
MPSLAVARAFNVAFSPAYTPVAIFAFARHTKGNAHIVIVGRNRAAGEAILRTFPKPTCDITLMKNVHRVAGELRARIPKVNFLVLTPGVMTMNGRNETEEGIDRKLAVHYYGRWRFIRDLLPAVEDAHKAGEDAKVMSVLSAGKGAGKIDLEDLGLKKNFSVMNAALAAPTYNDLMVMDLAARHPGLTFVHSYPGFVASNLVKSSDTRLMRLTNTFLMPFLSLFSYSIEASGEHQLYTLLKAGAGPVRTDDRGDDIGLSKGYFGSPEAMAKLWRHTEDETRVV